MLSEKRAQFVQRQAQVQARTASDAAARAKAANNSRPVAAAAAAAAAKPASAPALLRANWLADTDKYAHILEVRRMPVGAQMKKIIDLLDQTRRALTPEEIGEATYVDIGANAELQSSLQSNLKVSFDGQCYSYKAKYSLKGKEELLRLIRDHKDGIPLSEVKDSYLTVTTDVQELRAAGQVWVLQNSDSQEEVLYPNDPKIQISVDDDIKQLVRAIKLPDWHDMERELKRGGMVPAISAARRESMLASVGRQKDQPKVKKRRESKRTKYTNSHLPDLLRGIEMPPGM